jgi:hypothetical protein
MKISGLVQAPFNTTMMGVMRGALNYYGLPPERGGAARGCLHPEP